MQIDLELYREEVAVGPDVTISVIDVSPERPQRTLVLVHGFGGRARQWRYQIEQFAQYNRVLAIDLRGHGRSSRPTTGYDMPTMLRDLVRVLERRGVVKPFVLVGHSYGGAIVTEFASQYPERVSHLIMIASAGEYRLATTFRLIFNLPAPLVRILQPIADLTIDASLRSLKAFYDQNLVRWSGWELFPRLKPPTMVIMGERDLVFPRAAFDRVAELLPPDSEVVNVGVSAHMVMLERRDAVNRAIERFIEPETGPVYSRWRTGRSAGSLVAERPWLARYESGVPHTIDVPRLPLTRLLDRAWRRFPGRPAILFLGRAISYRHVSGQAARFANALEVLGVAKRTRVMILLPNVPQLVIAFHGTLRLGAIAVLANPLSSTEEIVREAQLSGAEILVTLTKFEETAVAVKARGNVRHIIYTNFKDYLPAVKKLLFTWRVEKQEGHRLRRPVTAGISLWFPLLRAHKTTPPAINVSPEDTAVIQFTSGTTGDPKGITLTHRNLVANTMQVRSWLPNTRDGDEVILCVVPFCHVYGMTTGMNFAISAGASMVLLPRFDTEEVLQYIKRYRPTLFPGVPAMYVALNNFPGVRKYNVSSIRACISGAAPLPIEVKETFEKLTRGKLVEGYGLSEASPVTHANPINGQSRTGSIGLPLPSTEARIVDLKDGQPLPPGQIGELVVRGPQVMKGYWENMAATADMIDSDGWLHTNDIARMDEDGYFQIISRRQDMWQVEDSAPAFPRDVEEVIYELPEVREVVVIAVANQPIAFVSLKAKNRVPASTIIEFCRRRLPPSQVPRLVIFVKEFPRSFIGKILRRELVSQYAQEITRAEAGTVGDYLAGLDDG